MLRGTAFTLTARGVAASGLRTGTGPGEASAAAHRELRRPPVNDPRPAGHSRLSPPRRRHREEKRDVLAVSWAWRRGRRGVGGGPDAPLDGERRLESVTVADKVSALVVDVGGGNLTVRGTDAEATSATAWIRDEYCELDQDLAAGTLRLESRRDRGHPLRRRCKIDLEISVPADAGRELGTGSGNVDVAHVEGALDVNTGSGNVDLADVTGAVTLDTSSGNIDAHQLASSRSMGTGSFIRRSSSRRSLPSASWDTCSIPAIPRPARCKSQRRGPRSSAISGR